MKSLLKNHSANESIISEGKRILMNNFNQIEFQNKEVVKVVIFVTSSTGDGEFPDNGLKFQSYLRKESSKTALSHIFYTILGLGDSNYSKFQGAPRFLDQRLMELGAKKFYKRGEADDATNLALVVEPWLAGLPQALKQEINRLKSLPAQEFQSLQQTIVQSSNADQALQLSVEDQSTTNYRATLIERSLICEEEDKQVYVVKLKLQRSVNRDRLDVGQSIQIFPRNIKLQVDRIVQAFAWNKDQLIGNYTIEEILMSKIDISKRKLNLEGLVKHFQMFTSDFDDDLTRLIGEERTKYTLLELVEQSEPFTQGRFMLSEACIEDGLLKLQPRYYSILDDPYAKNDDGLAQECQVLSLGFTHHKFINDFGIYQQGLCTSYLANTELFSTIDCQISKNTRILQLPKNMTEKSRIIIICMGTGVVPFIGMLQRIKALQIQCQIQMFYGVRNDQKSFYFGQFLIDFFSNLNSKNHLYVACSRSQIEEVNRHVNVTFEKGKLQQSLSKFCLKRFTKLEKAEEIIPQPDSQTHILICGNKNALQKSVFECIKLSEATKRQLQDEGRLLMELWNE